MAEDPGTGEELSREGAGPVAGERAEPNDPQLLLYSLLRDEILTRIGHQHRSLFSGLSVIGIVIAYALLSGEFVFLAVVPVVIGFLAVQTVRQLNGILYHASHLARIERAYVDESPLFAWEHRYGMGGAERGIERWGFNWTHVPQGIVLTLAGLGYLASIYVAYTVWPPAGVDILRIGLTRGGLLGIYGLLTVLIGFAGYSYYLHQDELT